MRHVVAGIDVGPRVAGAEGHAGQDGPYPVNRRRGAGPREPDLPKWRDESGYAQHRHHCLGSDATGVGLGSVTVNEAPQKRFRYDGHDCADRDACEGGAGSARFPASDVGEYDGVCDEAEIEDAVDCCRV